MPNDLMRPKFPIDELYRADSARHFNGERLQLSWNSRRKALELIDPRDLKQRVRKLAGTYTSKPINARFQFHEIIPSWNIQLDEQTDGYRVWLRVGDGDKSWSPWFYFGSGGTFFNTTRQRTIESSRWGKLNIDYLQLSRPADRFQYKIELRQMRGAATASPALKRFFVAYSNTKSRKPLFQKFGRRVIDSTAKAASIKVPYRSQLAVPDQKVGRVICCPTCVAMMLEYWGTNYNTMDVARQVYDPEHKIYGVWPRAVQAAANQGYEAWIERFRNHADVKRVIRQGQPVMASIRVRKGELDRSGYKVSGGHLILLVGTRRGGDYVVNDPYSPGPKGAEILYTEEDIAKVWLDKGGVGIIIRPSLEES